MKDRELKTFLKESVIPELPGFYLHENQWVIRISSIFVHGLLFDRTRQQEVFCIKPFISFLTSGQDFIGLTVSDRLASDYDGAKNNEFFHIDSSENCQRKILGAFKASEYYPHVLQPTTGSILTAFDERLWNPWGKFGLGCCAVFESEIDRARKNFEAFLTDTEWLKNSWATRPRIAVTELLKHASDLSWCRNFLLDRAEETIKRQGLQDIAKLSGWSRPS